MSLPMEAYMLNTLTGVDEMFSDRPIARKRAEFKLKGFFFRQLARYSNPRLFEVLSLVSIVLMIRNSTRNV